MPGMKAMKPDSVMAPCSPKVFYHSESAGWSTPCLWCHTLSLSALQFSNLCLCLRGWAVQASVVHSAIIKSFFPCLFLLYQDETPVTYRNLVFGEGNRKPTPERSTKPEIKKDISSGVMFLCSIKPCTGLSPTALHDIYFLSFQNKQKLHSRKEEYQRIFPTN